MRVGTSCFCLVMAYAGYAVTLPRIEVAPLSIAVAPAATRGLPTLYVFDDFECEGCAQFDRLAAARLREWQQEGRVQVVYYHTPLSTHSRSRFAAAAVACAPAGLSNHFRTRLHSNRSWLYADDPAGAAVTVVGAKDNHAFLSCMRADSTSRKLADDAALGRKAAIRAVPTVWLNNMELRFRTYAALLRHLERAL